MRTGTAILALTVALTAGGCDYLAQKELKPGVSTVAQVREYMGLQETVWQEPDGTQIHEYRTALDTYMIVIDKSGIFRSMANVRVPAQFRKIVPGTDQGTVRRMLGKPDDVEYFKPTNELVWTYPHAAKTGGKAFFHVYFSDARRVIRTETMMDYDPGGN